MLNGKHLKSILSQFSKDYPKEFTSYSIVSLSANRYEMIVRFALEENHIIYKLNCMSENIECVRLDRQSYINIR